MNRMTTRLSAWQVRAETENGMGNTETVLHSGELTCSTMDAPSQELCDSRYDQDQTARKYSHAQDSVAIVHPLVHSHHTRIPRESMVNRALT